MFHVGGDAGLVQVAGLPIEAVHRLECEVCPLNLSADLCHPKMPAYGPQRALIYALGEAPGEIEDARGRPFVGPAGQLLHQHLPDGLAPRIRFNNVVRCWPPKINGSAAPVELQIEACRPSIERDIVETKPRAIFGFGNVPLQWALGVTGITSWCGRRVPIEIAGHRCWFFPLVHPSYVLRSPERLKPDREFTFALQLKRAVAAVEKLPEPRIHSRDQALADLELITGAGGDADLARLKHYLRSLAGEIVGFDYETNALRPYNDDSELLSVAIAGPKRSLAVALQHRERDWPKGMLPRVWELLHRFITRGGARLVSHHLPFELEWTGHTFGLLRELWQTQWGDTESQAYVLDERPGMLSLDTLCRQYFGLALKSISNLDRHRLADTPLPDVLRYNALDAKYHRLLYLAQRERLRAEKLERVYAHQLKRTIAVVPSTLEGIPIDVATNVELLNAHRRKLKRIEQQIAGSEAGERYRSELGKPYQPSSPDVVKRYLARFRGIRIDHADESTLREIDDQLIVYTRRWRRVNKVLSTYILPMAANSEHIFDDGKLHPITKTCVTRTWRTSGEDPNMQNWPKRARIAQLARTQVYPGPDQRVVAFDFSGIQARNVAMESQDKTLVQAFWERYDIHADWMKRIVARLPDWIPGGRKMLGDKEVKKKYRQRAKNELVFPLFFGSPAFALAMRLGCDEHAAAQLWDEFGREYPDIFGWHERVIKNYRKTGYVTGLSGFRRRAPVERNQLINSPIQADEAIIVCSAMARLSQRGLHCAMEVHDDLTFIWPKREIDDNAPVVLDEMLRISFPWVNVPLQVEMSVGKDWGSMQPAGEFESVGLSNKWREIA